jgi:hypothetical protein
LYKSCCGVANAITIAVVAIDIVVLLVIASKVVRRQEMKELLSFC